MRSLLARLERLERDMACSSWDKLPDEVRERHDSLVLHLFVHGVTGRPTGEFMRKLEAMGPLPVESGPGPELSDLDVILRMTSLTCMAARRDPANRRLLEMLRDARIVDERQFRSCLPA